MLAMFNEAPPAKYVIKSDLESAADLINASTSPGEIVFPLEVTHPISSAAAPARTGEAIDVP